MADLGLGLPEDFSLGLSAAVLGRLALFGFGGTGMFAITALYNLLAPESFNYVILFNHHDSNRA